jgi:predicted esterase
MASDANRKTPIFMGHGDRDPVVQFAYGSKSADLLKSKGYNVEFHSYKGVVHTASDEEISDVAKFLNGVLTTE